MTGTDNSQEHVVIIGGSSGIGLAAARMLSMRRRVTIAGRSQARLDAARAELDGDVRAMVLDASDAEARSAFFAAIGRFDHLVLALGGNRGIGPLAGLSEADIVAPFEQKVFPQLLCLQSALPHIRPDGSITLLSAVSAQAAMPGTAALGAANAAVAAVAPILAAELRPLRVNVVSPGVVETPWWDFLDEASRQEAFAGFAARTPVGRNGRAEDVAEAIAFLIGNGFTNGALLICDGGARLGTGG